MRSAENRLGSFDSNSTLHLKSVRSECRFIAAVAEAGNWLGIPADRNYTGDMEMFLVASFLGVVIGAVLQYFFAQRAEVRRNIQVRRTEAYVDLVKAISSLSKLGGDQQADAARQAGALLTEARTRIAIYGSTEVNAALAKFFSTPGEFGSSAASAALVEVVKAMRVDGLDGHDALPDDDLKAVIFGRN